MQEITNLRQSFINASESVRNQLAKQFQPLVSKIVRQQLSKLKTDWLTLESMAQEGLVLAMNKYDPERSKMDFKQFAAFEILNNIRNCSGLELHTVKLTSYTQGQIKSKAEGSEEVGGGIGTTTFTTVNISSVMSPEGSENTNREVRYGMYENATFAEGDIMEHLKVTIQDKFNETDCYCFLSYFGICGYEEKKVTELAEELGVTSGRVSQRINKVKEFIKKDSLLVEGLAQLAG